ncbi:MAG: T9SS type A sorting domain-containing protein [Bacteroidia bacterium]|nr:T9SS type A sorting domain-containing protein [Bacteroidia bacterium]
MSKYYLIVFLSFFLTIERANCGSLFTISEDTAWGCGSAADFAITSNSIKVTNISSNSINITWRKLIQNVGTWETAVQDKNNTYLSSVTEKSFALSPSEEADLRMHLYPDGVPGSGSIELLVFNADSSSATGDTILFNFEALNLSLGSPSDTTIYCGDTVTIDGQGFGYDFCTWTSPLNYVVDSGDCYLTVNPPTTQYYYLNYYIDSLPACEMQQSIRIEVVLPTANDICMVTVDSASGFNAIIWDTLPQEMDIFYEIYRQKTDGTYEEIGQNTQTNGGIFLDSTSNPSQKADRYYIITSDNCSNLVYSSTHKTIHLTMNQGINGEINLIWDDYEGFNYNTYMIWRGSAKNNMSLIDSVQSSLTSYTDLTPPSGGIYYQIGITHPSGCDPGTGKRIQDFNSARSNVVDNSANSIKKIKEDNSKLKLYPNPADNSVSFELPFEVAGLKYEFFNNLGQIVLFGNLTSKSIDISKLQQGLYHVKVYSNKGIYHQELEILH